MSETHELGAAADTIRQYREILVQLAESDLPVAEYARQALDVLEQEEN